MKLSTETKTALTTVRLICLGSEWGT